MKPQEVKQALYDTIQVMTDHRSRFSVRPGKDHTRNRKFPFQKMLASLLAFRGGTLNREIADLFGLEPSVGTSSAFIQQRAKILPEAFEYLFRHFTNKIDENKLLHGLRLLAVDGSDLQIAADPNDPESFFPGTGGKKAYNLLHVNAIYDLTQHIYLDALLQKKRKQDEVGALTDMIDRLAIEKALILADRGYEAYNALAHIQEKGWYFLFRIKDSSTGITKGLILPDQDKYDLPFHLKLTRKQSKPVQERFTDKNHYKWLTTNIRFDYLPKKVNRSDAAVFYDLRFRIVRFPISDTTCETIITNLDPDLFPSEAIKQLYTMRWGIETSFRDLKYALGLLRFHTKKVEFVHQELFAKLTMYNFCQAITRSVVIQQRQKKYAYKVNFSDAIHVCFQFFLGKVPPPHVEALLTKYISPIRPGRNNTRRQTRRATFSFTYRIA